MTRKRDLSGFGEGPSPRRKRASVEPPSPPSQERSIAAEVRPLVPGPPQAQDELPANDETSTAEKSARSGKKPKQRITLSLPTSVAQLLRSTADRENRIYLDIILEAFLAHNLEVDESLIERRRSGSLSTKGGRRRSDSGRTQIPLNILKEDLGELDKKATRIALDRSAYVTELLVRSLAG